MILNSSSASYFPEILKFHRSNDHKVLYNFTKSLIHQPNYYIGREKLKSRLPDEFQRYPFDECGYDSPLNDCSDYIKALPFYFLLENFNPKEYVHLCMYPRKVSEEQANEFDKPHNKNDVLRKCSFMLISQIKATNHINVNNDVFGTLCGLSRSRTFRQVAREIRNGLWRHLVLPKAYSKSLYFLDELDNWVRTPMRKELVAKFNHILAIFHPLPIYLYSSTQLPSIFTQMDKLIQSFELLGNGDGQINPMVFNACFMGYPMKLGRVFKRRVHTPPCIIEAIFDQVTFIRRQPTNLFHIIFAMFRKYRLNSPIRHKFLELMLPIVNFDIIRKEIICDAGINFYREFLFGIRWEYLSDFINPDFVHVIIKSFLTTEVGFYSTATEFFEKVIINCKKNGATAEELARRLKLYGLVNFFMIEHTDMKNLWNDSSYMTSEEMEDSDVYSVSGQSFSNSMYPYENDFFDVLMDIFHGNELDSDFASSDYDDHESDEDHDEAGVMMGPFNIHDEEEDAYLSDQLYVDHRNGYRNHQGFFENSIDSFYMGDMENWFEAKYQFTQVMKRVLCLS